MLTVLTDPEEVQLTLGSEGEEPDQPLLLRTRVAFENDYYFWNFVQEAARGVIVVSDRYTFAIGIADLEYVMVEEPEGTRETVTSSFENQRPETEVVPVEEEAPQTWSSDIAIPEYVKPSVYSETVEFLCNPLPTETNEDIKYLRASTALCNSCREQRVSGLAEAPGQDGTTVNSSNWIFNTSTQEWGCIGPDDRYYCSPRCSKKAASVRRFPLGAEKDILEGAMFPLRLRAQGFMASITHDALSETSREYPLTKLIARALGHYGMKESAAAQEQAAWDSPAVKAVMEARVKRAAQRLAANYVSVTYSAFEAAW